ncbi:MAG: BlaI/MecI/CopY family transcriptional regulator [Gemmatimonadota bacterium]|nr:BlaI/MecI/CopY family transcriptional regulator [Gemmatimonadota bacterium]
MPVQLTKRELDVMSVIWDLGSATVGEVKDRLQDKLAYSTVLTVFRTLTSKGFVRFEEEGKAYRYYPLIQPDDAGDSALDRLLDKVYQGSRELMIARLVENKEVSADELRKIKETLDKRLEELES